MVLDSRLRGNDGPQAGIEMADSRSKTVAPVCDRRLSRLPIRASSEACNSKP